MDLFVWEFKGSQGSFYLEELMEFPPGALKMVGPHPLPSFQPPLLSKARGPAQFTLKFPMQRAAREFLHLRVLEETSF